jgi:hypothetical protein
MFDGNADYTAGADENVARLCALYDGLLERPEATVSDEAAAELKALAQIFDLDADRPAGELWPAVRAVLVRQAPAETPVTTPQIEPLTVLLVEDDAEAAAALTEALDAAGHRIVGPFHSAEAAEAATALHPIDVALLDITPPPPTQNWPPPWSSSPIRGATCWTPWRDWSAPPDHLHPATKSGFTLFVQTAA